MLVVSWWVIGIWKRAKLCCDYCYVMHGRHLSSIVYISIVCDQRWTSKKIVENNSLCEPWGDGIKEDLIALEPYLTKCHHFYLGGGNYSIVVFVLIKSNIDAWKSNKIISMDIQY